MQTDLRKRLPGAPERKAYGGAGFATAIRWLMSLAFFLTSPLVNSSIAQAEFRALEVPEHRYVGVRKCAGCHKKKTLGNQLAVWEGGPHASAMKTLESPASAAIAQKLGLTTPATEAPECLRCHVTAFGLPKESFAYEVDPADGVQCESCHGPGRDYRKKKIMSDPELAAKKGLWDTDDPKICTRCHNAESPTFDPKRFRRPDGTTSAFDFDLATAQILHPIPEDVKGHYLEIEARLKAEGKKPE